MLERDHASALAIRVRPQNRAPQFFQAGPKLARKVQNVILDRRGPDLVQKVERGLQARNAHLVDVTRLEAKRAWLEVEFVVEVVGPELNARLPCRGDPHA